ncbi:MFS transporter [Salininema proteolyticum]|uniref:MFS transporter n=1 Tax=Salininema proteolyticum TaxID=1607685 RepID=A0ABV8U106_9ACTN
MNAADTQRAPARKTQWIPLAALAAGMFAVTSETTMISVALPEIAREFAVSPTTAAWALLAYSLPVGAVAIPAGRWADQSDPRRVFTLSMAGIAATTVLAGLAPTWELLIAGRLLQGLTGGLVMAVYMPIVLASSRPETRARVMAGITTVMTIGAMAGTSLSGGIADAWGWRAVILSKLVILVPVLLMGWFGIPGNGKGLALPKPALLVELAVLGGALSLGILGFGELAELRISSAFYLAGAVALGIAWTRLKGTRPVVALLSVRQIGHGTLALALMSTIVGVSAFLLPYFIDEVVGGGPAQTGIVLLAFVAGMGVMTPLAGTLADKFGAGPVTTVGAFTSLASMAAFYMLGPDATSFDMIAALGLVGIGFGVFSSPVITAIVQSAPDEAGGTVGGLNATARTVGSNLGPALAALGWTIGGAGMAGFQAGLTVITVVMAIGVALILVGRMWDVKRVAA